MTEYWYLATTYQRCGRHRRRLGRWAVPYRAAGAPDNARIRCSAHSPAIIQKVLVHLAEQNTTADAKIAALESRGVLWWDIQPLDGVTRVGDLQSPRPMTRAG